MQLNKTAQLLTFDPQVSIEETEKFLRSEGLTGGYYPLSGYHTLWTDCLAERRPNLYFLKYGGLEELCAGGLVKLPSGKLFSTKIYPRSATGPDLRRVVLGSRHVLGDFEEVTVRCFPLPEKEMWGLVLFETWEEAHDVVRKMMGFFIRPLCIRLLKEEAACVLLENLGYSGEDQVLLAFKLSGLARMVAAEKGVISHWVEDKQSFWPTDKRREEKLDQEFLTAASHQAMYVSLPKPLKMENDFIKQMKEGAC